jgi:Na+/H+ antiporter NhaC
MRNLNREARSPKMWATSIIFGKLAKESNRTLGENSPKLVTLSLASSCLSLKLGDRMSL